MPMKKPPAQAGGKCSIAADGSMLAFREGDGGADYSPIAASQNAVVLNNQFQRGEHGRNSFALADYFLPQVGESLNFLFAFIAVAAACSMSVCAFNCAWTA